MRKKNKSPKASKWVKRHLKKRRQERIAVKVARRSGNFAQQCRDAMVGEL